MDRADFLLEIGSEEIPAGYLNAALRKLSGNIQKFMKEKGLDHDTVAVKCYCTPRRLAVLVPGLSLNTPVREQLRLGPNVAAAFDQNGEPTPAARGFARSVGAEVSDLGRFDSDKGERLGMAVKTGGESALDLLMAEGVLESWLALGFPKTMRWIPGSDLAYARPIRWIVCLLGEKPVPLRLAHLTAGRTSHGHRTLAPGRVEIAAAADYESKLERASVVVSGERRRETIETEARSLAASVGGVLHEAPDLLEEVVNLVEHPTGIMGEFEQAIAETLPREVIITAMRSHQRYFSVERADGQLLPRFITFRDGGDHGLDNVREGNERVLRARLDDALFYWNEDRAVSSDEKLQRLDAVVWLEGLGSVGDKCRRIAALSTALAKQWSSSSNGASLERAALLCKSDLATEMIKDGKEFTKLQGVMGRYYAMEAGEPDDVADAIREHLHPRFAEDRLPEGEIGLIVALADRLDSIAGCILAGFAPTGSQDPYALRRQALAILRILVESGRRLDLESWLDRALAAYEPETLASQAAASRATELFWGRLETLLGDLPSEIVRAVLSVSPLDPMENVRAARDLAGLRGQESFAMLLEGAKRCRNILVKADRLPEEELEAAERAHALQAAAREHWSRREIADTDVESFEEDAERHLVAESQGRLPDLSTALSTGDYTRAFEALSSLGPAIDRYFTEVLVNAEDDETRHRRLDWLEALHYLFARFADLSRVPSS